jgi:alcohol dehydrogenase class IV
MWAAILAGMAFGNTGTPLPHGISVIVTTPASFRYTAEAAPERHFEAATYLNADQRGAEIADAGENVVNCVIELIRNTNMPNRLSGVGFCENDITRLAESSIRQARAIANAPRESNKVDLENIYQDAIRY